MRECWSVTYIYFMKERIFVNISSVRHSLFDWLLETSHISPAQAFPYETLLRFQALVIMSSKYSSLSMVELMLV